MVGRGSFTLMTELAALGTPSVHIVDQSNYADLFHARRFSALGTIRLLEKADVSVKEFAGALDCMFEWSAANRAKIEAVGKRYRASKAILKVTEIVKSYLC